MFVVVIVGVATFLSVCLSVLEEEGDELYSLQRQVSTVTQALNTLTEEKSKMEISFQQDKKRLLVRREGKGRGIDDGGGGGRDLMWSHLVFRPTRSCWEDS